MPRSDTRGGEEVDEILGYVAAESNHAKSRKIQTELDRLAGMLEAILAADGASPSRSGSG